MHLYLFGPGRFVTRVDRVFVVVQLFFVSRPWLLLLLLQRDQVGPLLLQLPLQPFSLTLLLQLLPFIFLDTTENENEVKRARFEGHMKQMLHMRQNNANRARLLYS